MTDKNYVMLVGSLGRDAEVRYHNNEAMATLRIATTERWRNAKEEQHERTEWHDVKAFRRVAEACDGLVKGEYILVEGSLRTEEWTGKDGAKRSAKVVVAARVEVLERRQPAKKTTVSSDTPTMSMLPPKRGEALPTGSVALKSDDNDDELPF